ncbi:MAG: glycosyltransferase family 4 protein [Acidobacteriota bacterium]|nr:glycosyltransferase family 4 protein [Acidobacteriota bacterium]
MPFRAVIDARRIRDFGIGTYIRNFIRALSRVDSENHYTLVVPESNLPEFSNLPSNFESALFQKADGPALAQIGYRLALKRFAADLYHIPLNAVPLWMPKPYVVTIHDMGGLLFDNPRGLRNSLQLFRLRRGLLRADRVIAVSQATRRDIETVLQIPSRRIRTIYNAPDPIFSEPSSPVHSGEETGFAYPPGMQRTLERYNIHSPFLLYVGRTNPQKNIPRLVEAFAVLSGELETHPVYKDLRLIIIGDEISRYPALRHAVIQSRVEHAVRFLGFVPIETLRVFYQAASAFVFPSLYEGFGLPPLEAMACGTPVVCSSVSSLPEVVGDAAEIVNPENVFDIARGIREVLLNRERRARLVEKGFYQLKRFSWDRTAAEVLETYREVASLKTRPR